MKSILYFPSEEYGSNHTSVEALFNKYLKKYFEIRIVYKDIKTRKVENNNLTINYKNKSRFFSEIISLTSEEFDFVIVRNDFSVLNDVINYKNKFNKSFKIGFQCTFLHSYRRIVQAHIEKKALIRKYLQYSFTQNKEEKLIQKCDFLIPNSKMMNKIVNKFNLPYTFIHSSIDLELLPNTDIKKDDTLTKFVYIGTIDKLREVDLIFKAFEKINKKEWILDIYTKDIDIANQYKNEMQYNKDKVIIHGSLNRNELYERISHYDVGISLIPINDLYVVASPIKLSEYFACKLSVMTTAIPEAVDLYANKNCAFFVNFDLDSIIESINEVLLKDKKELKIMGENGFEIVKEKRNYQLISLEMKSFLEKL
ncbi:MAG: glycosyltransferase [Aliarcobacter sp.]|jgi:glycosyltransferase involved in cell wall biosynthesis|nr:glycosyltransferase [Aliarcobacter sp.]